MMNVNYKKVGLKVGLECHQQLETDEKLFCSCQPKLFRGKPDISFIRKLRPTQSELGQIDPAADFEFSKGFKIRYEGSFATSCLVEMDEEPPHLLNQQALEICLIISNMLNAKIVDEVHIMRKVVIDGSNTTGFQRTCVVALNGEITVDGKKIPIEHISLEEDAARKVKTEGQTVRYRIDRLCIPLVEVTTAPNIFNPEEAEKVAEAIGQIMRSTKKVKRGLGTIRQDLNISIKDGALVEVKGVQDLGIITKVVENEVQRQINLLLLRDEIKQRKFKKSDLDYNFFNVTPIFSGTDTEIVRRIIGEKQVFAVKLPKFSGLLKRKLCAGLTLGAEMSDRAKFWGRVRGILHSDEFLIHGLKEAEISNIRKLLNAKKKDAVVIVAGGKENAEDALKAVVERAAEVLDGVPEETRASDINGASHFMRPRPGSARMYPETDVPPTVISRERVLEIKTDTPQLPEHEIRNLVSRFGLNKKLAKQIQSSDYVELFETILKQSKLQASFVAATLTETFKSMKREGIAIENLNGGQIINTFKLASEGKTSKEAIPEILAWLTKNRQSTPLDAVGMLGLAMITKNALEKIVDMVIIENKKIVEEKGPESFGFLMGIIMKDYRGKVETGLLSSILRKKIVSDQP